jgi:serine/threonine-protein kinase
MDLQSPESNEWTNATSMVSTDDWSRFDPRFHVIRELGVGACAKVILCTDDALEGMTVAVKVMHKHIAGDATQRERFKREAEFAKRIRHPNIVSILDYGMAVDGSPFIVMEYVQGVTLRNFEKERKKTITLAEQLAILTGIAKGLQCAHQAGLTHRDIKPDNILIDDVGTPRISDFGVAKAADQDMKLTMTGDVVGTPVYMSPEQFQGTSVDARTDIYCYGILAYELLAGDIPFVADTYQAMANAHLLQEMPSVCDKAPSVPRWLDDLVQLCTQKEPRHRYQSMDEILADLERDRTGFWTRLFRRRS